ncbi:MAG: signal recognition particle protein [Deltaproteobacteria bacterium]|nr:signal recognition particle protein [Deltaproteobacteria bacterium]
MFETITKGFRVARQRLQGLAELDEANIDTALRDVRASLLEADVELGIVKQFLASVKAEAIGQVVQTKVEHKGKKLKISPGDVFIKVCQDQLIEMMKAEGEPVVWAPKGQVTGVMMVGLQGSGKTTTTAKLARLFQKEGHKPLLVAADTQRPGAVDQLQVLGERLDVPVFAIPGGNPLDICTRALEHAKRIHRDVILYDTAGRLAIDERLMDELGAIKTKTKPQNVFLVVDAMIGQDSVRTAAAFHDKLGLTGVVLTKLDGDARGGAAISIRNVTGAPIRFAGMGEGLDKLEPFRADGMASRILGMGDIVGLMKDFEEVVDEKKAEEDAMRMLKGRFTLSDFLEQIQTIQKMGPLQDIFEKLPFFPGGLPEGVTLDDKELVKIKAMIASMTRRERERPELFQKQSSRIDRVAKGSGRQKAEVVELLNRFMGMRKMMEDIGSQASMLAKIPGLRQLANASKLRDAMRVNVDDGAGMFGNPMMGDLATTLLEAAVAGQGGASQIRRKPTVSDKSKKKDKRRQEKKARKKARKK